MNTLDYLLKRYNIKEDEPSPIYLPHRRDELARLFRDLGYTSGAEIGVDRGIYSEMLCTINPSLRLYCIDPWKVYPEYGDIKSQDEMDVRYKQTLERLKPFECNIFKKTSMESVKYFDPESLDFVYIDGNHSTKYVLDDLNAWSKIVKKGHIISGHDYWSTISSHGNRDVTKAVDQYVKEHNLKLFVFVKRYDASWMVINS